jgi:hypothetical protein
MPAMEHSPIEHSPAVGVFTDRTQAERAIEALERAGFTDQQIGFVRRGEGTATPETAAPTGKHATVGVASGSVIGGIIGAAVSLLIPGIGPAVAGGILAAIVGGGALGAAAGGLIGAFTAMGVSTEEANYYQREFEAGRTIVTVRTEDRKQEAQDILRQYGGYNATTDSNSHPLSGTTDSSSHPLLGLG